MAWQTILLHCSIAAWIVFIAPLARFAAAQDQLPPTGTAVEVLDGAGRVQAAEFVEKTSTGLIKVKLSNGTTLTFPPNRVRLAGGNLPNRVGSTAGQPRMAKIRTWTDATGMFKVEAQFIGLADGKIELKKADGKTVSLQLDKLAQADQDIAKFLAESTNPFEADVKNLTETISTIVAIWPPAREAVFDVDQFPFVGLGSIPAEMPWRGTVDIPFSPPPTLTTRYIPIPEYRDDSFWARFDLLIDEPRSCAWVYQGIHRRIFATANPIYHVDRVNLRDGSLQPRILFAQRDVPLAIDPVGQKLVSVSEEGRFHVWKIAADKLTALKSFVIVKKSGSSFPEPIIDDKTTIDACFLDEQHLQIATEMGIFTIRLTDLQPLHRIAALNPALSPSRKQMVVGEIASGLFLVDPLSAKILGRFNGTDTPEQKVGSYVIPGQKFREMPYLNRVIFSQDGKEVIQVGHSELRFFDLQTGQQSKSVGTANSLTGSQQLKRFQLQWGYGGHVILDNRYAISTTKGVTVAHLLNEFEVGRSFGGREWFLSKNEERDVLKLTLQSGALVTEELISKANNNVSHLAIAPGTKFTIVYEYAGGTPSDADQARIQKAAAEKLQAMGATLATSGELPDHFLKFSQFADGPAYLHLGSMRRDEFYWWTMAQLPKEGPPAATRVEAFLQTIKQIPDQVRYYGQTGARLDVTITADGHKYREN